MKQNPTKEDVIAVRMLVRLREDFQAMRKRMDNRIGRKANGESQNIEERHFRVEDLGTFKTFADEAGRQEDEIEKALKKILKRFPIYTEWLQGVSGVGTIAAGWIIAEYNIHEATTVSKLWQFTGLNPGMVKGKKRVDNKDGSFSYVETGKMIRGDRLTPGHVAPFNKRLRVAMVGVLAGNLIKDGIRYEKAEESEYIEGSVYFKRSDKANKKRGLEKNDPLKLYLRHPDSYAKYYVEYKERLMHSDKKTFEMQKGGDVKETAWKFAKPAHIDRAAQRYMIKMFLKDLYVQWRTIEGLPVREPYQAEYLGHQHAA